MLRTALAAVAAVAAIGLLGAPPAQAGTCVGNGQTCVHVGGTTAAMKQVSPAQRRAASDRISKPIADKIVKHIKKHLPH
ncbi:hypothetical protein [Mycolicibacterium porcinum]